MISNDFEAVLLQAPLQIFGRASHAHSAPFIQQWTMRASSAPTSIALLLCCTCKPSMYAQEDANWHGGCSWRPLGCVPSQSVRAHFDDIVLTYADWAKSSRKHVILVPKR